MRPINRPLEAQLVICLAALGALLMITAWMLAQMLSILLLPVFVLDDFVAAQHASSKANITQGYQAWQTPSQVDLTWHPPERYFVNDLSAALNSRGTYGFIFNTSTTPKGTPYGTYNWCNMPHVRPSEYVRAPDSFKLRYVEVIHRHHKRTPYASNCFPNEKEQWTCGGSRLFNFAGGPSRGMYLETFWSIENSAPVNPFQSSGFPGDCAFPQETEEALLDSLQHGSDLYMVYGRMLGLLLGSSPGDGTVAFRVTNNVITSQVAGALIHGMFKQASSSPLVIQNSDIDSLEPSYSCPHADVLYASYGVGSSNTIWKDHLDRSRALFLRLDSVAGIDPADSAWHQSYDHYFDNLSARLCHNHKLPCKANDSSTCISREEANEVFRLGQYEYSYIYRDGGPDSLTASVASFGVWVAELSTNLRKVRDGTNDGLRYMHNIAHDGSISRLLSILQIQRMVWPGMGAEVVFELYQRSTTEWTVRVLWGGVVLRSSNPSLGVMDMIPLETLLAYFDGLSGPEARLVASKCGR